MNLPLSSAVGNSFPGAERERAAAADGAAGASLRLKGYSDPMRLRVLADSPTHLLLESAGLMSQSAPCRELSLSLSLASRCSSSLTVTIFLLTEGDMLEAWLVNPLKDFCDQCHQTGSGIIA